MKYLFTTDRQEMTLRIRVEAPQKAKLRLIAYDLDDHKRLFTNRFKTVSGFQDFFIRLPQSPDKLVICIYNEEFGDRKKDEETSFKLVEVQPLPLEKRLDVRDIKNEEIKSFVEFAQSFSYSSHELLPNTKYSSNDDRYIIELLPEIVSKKTNKPLNTPARISRLNGRIEVSKKSFDSMTVPMRFAILCHEYSHYFLNTKVDDEIEADLNGLLIYLSLGYPRIEASEAFLGTFVGMPTEQNKVRANRINQMIREFEKNNSIMIQK